MTKTVKFDTDLSLILEGFETALKNSFLVPHPMLSVQSYRRNSISKVELWRNRPFSGELPAFFVPGALWIDISMGAFAPDGLWGPFSMVAFALDGIWRFVLSDRSDGFGLL